MSKNERINTTLIIGNGFDRNLGMNTGYDSFFSKLESDGFFAKYEDNPLLAYIHYKGVKENWFSFEDIIKDFALHSKYAETLIYCQKMLKTVEDLQLFNNSAIEYIRTYEELTAIAPSLSELITICKNCTNANLAFQDSIREICHNIRKEISSYKDSIRDICKQGMTLLTKQIKSFIKEAKPNNEYAAAIKITCALLGCDGNGFNSWSDNILKKYNPIQNKYYFPDFNFISFNYTDALKLVTHIIEMHTFKTLSDDKLSFNEYVFNIHGTLSNQIAFGADEDENIPQELWVLRKCSMIEENVKQRFHKALYKSKRIVIFGHSVHGIDFEYYKDFFKNKSNRACIYILSHTNDSLDEIKRGLEEKGVSVRAKYVLSDINDDDFCNLCEEINKEQYSLLNEYLAMSLN